MKKLVLSFVLFLSAASAGCALLNVSLTPATKPLVEEKVEGEGKPKILLIDLDGMISFKEKSDGLIMHRTRPSKVAFFREALRKAEKDNDIAGVILRINSPGGSVGASDAIYHEIMSFKQKRKVPVYAHIMELGASGAYYIAAASDRIVASPAAVTGSIGVIAMKFNLEGLFSKVGASSETYKSGPMKDFWSPFRPSTPEEQKMLQGIIDGLYSSFVGVVSANRRKLLTVAEVKSFASGRIFTAEEALAAHLIDNVAYPDETVEMMKKELNIAQARVVTYTRPGTFKSNIYSEADIPAAQVVNLLSINAEDLSSFSGVQFMYLWNP